MKVWAWLVLAFLKLCLVIIKSCVIFVFDWNFAVKSFVNKKPSRMMLFRTDLNINSFRGIDMFGNLRKPLSYYSAPPIYISTNEKNDIY